MKRVDLSAVGLLLLGLIAAPARGDDPNSKMEPFTFAQVCDPQLGFGGYDHDKETFRRAVRQINSLKPDFVVICGDLVNGYSDQSIADFLEINRGFKMPSYCVMGNHDASEPPTPTSLSKYRATVGEDYYAVEHKGYAFVFANSEFWKTTVDVESVAHDAWFRQTLQTAHAKNRPIFVVQHYSLYLTTPDEADGYWTLPLAVRPALLSLYTDNGVVAVLSGHLHKTLLNQYQNVALVTAGAVSKNLDDSPIGFRLWHVDSPTSIRSEFVPLTISLDADSNEKIGMTELCRLTGSWLSDEASVDFYPGPWGDGVVNFLDLAALAQSWRRDLRLLAYWMLDETEGTIAHDSAGGHDGAVHGNPVWKPAAGWVGGALQFDGIADYVITERDMNPGAAAFSVYAWVRGGAPGQVILSQKGGLNWLSADAAKGTLMTALRGTGRADQLVLVSPAVITDSQWHRVGFVWDGSRRTLYVDDVPVATDTLSSMRVLAGFLQIGAGNTLTPGTFWSGLIDDVRLYNRVVTP